MRKFLGVLVIVLCLVVGSTGIASMRHARGHHPSADRAVLLCGPLDGDDDKITGG